MKKSRTHTPVDVKMESEDETIRDSPVVDVQATGEDDEAPTAPREDQAADPAVLGESMEGLEPQEPDCSEETRSCWGPWRNFGSC